MNALGWYLAGTATPLALTAALVVGVMMRSAWDERQAHRRHYKAFRAGIDSIRQRIETLDEQARYAPDFAAWETELESEMDS